MSSHRENSILTNFANIAFLFYKHVLRLQISVSKPNTSVFLSCISTAIAYHDMPSHMKYISAHNYNMQKYVIQACMCKFSSKPFSKKYSDKAQIMCINVHNSTTTTTTLWYIYND